MHKITLVKACDMQYISPMQILEQLGRRIAQLRREQKLSRRELALKAGLSPRFLADVESGRGNIAFSRLQDLCIALQQPLAAVVASLPSAQRVSDRSRVVALV